MGCLKLKTVTERGTERAQHTYNADGFFHPYWRHILLPPDVYTVCVYIYCIWDWRGHTVKKEKKLSKLKSLRKPASAYF